MEESDDYEIMRDGSFFKDWQDCLFDGCKNKRCIRLRSKYCYPHTHSKNILGKAMSTAIGKVKDLVGAK